MFYFKTQNLLDSIVFTCADPIDESKTLDKIAFSISLSLSKLNSLYSNGSSSSSSSMAMANGRNQVASNATSSTGSASDPYRSALLKLETELRSVLLKMLVVDTRVPPLPVDANWSLAVVTKNTSSLQEQGIYCFTRQYCIVMKSYCFCWLKQSDFVMC